jgi:type II secretory pathway pseudopilin PulG
MRRAHGFTYIGLLIVVALLTLGLAAIGQVWSTAAKRERERELLFVGDQFRRAIGSYFETSPGAAKQYPSKLEDLLEDQRFPMVKRHLRKIYLDPMTGSREWGLVTQGDRITGVYSRSEDRPLKTGNFDSADRAFADSNAYLDWHFVYTPAAAPSPTPGGAPGGQPPQAAAQGVTQPEPSAGPPTDGVRAR